MPTKYYRKRDLPISIPLTCLRGDTLRSSLYKHLQPDKVTPVDLTGCTLNVAGTLADGTAIDLTPYLVSALATGRYRVIVPPAVTNGATPWPAGLGSYKITLTDTLGVVTTYYAGDLGLKEADHA